MAHRTSAGDLIGRACERFDCATNGLAAAASGAWRGGFAAGGHWMWLALSDLRGAALPTIACNCNRLGVVKYALAIFAASVPIGLAVVLRQPCVAIAAVPVFYAVEVQFVFLFPLALDGCATPFRTSLRWTRLAGGTVAAMRVVLSLAIVMLFGGFVGRGFVRSWCLGCLAVCIWYEDVRCGLGDSGT